MENKERLRILIIMIIVIVLLVGSNQYFLNKQEVKLKEIERSNMLSSCYKGCQFATQPTFEIVPIEDFRTRAKLYDDCVNLCEDMYKR